MLLKEVLFTSEYMRKMLSSLDDDWKEVRKRLSPVFSSGKIKNVSLFIDALVGLIMRRNALYLLITE